MTSAEHRARCAELRGGVTPSEELILRDLAACEKERDEMRQGRENYLDSAKDAEARALAAEAALKRVRESRGTVAYEVSQWLGEGDTRTMSARFELADRILAAILEEKA